jgi:hypothetical protein
MVCLHYKYMNEANFDILYTIYCNLGQFNTLYLIDRMMFLEQYLMNN